MKPQTPHQIAARLTEELRTLYRDHNDGPRLIAEMLREFPYPRKILTADGELTHPATQIGEYDGRRIR